MSYSIAVYSVSPIVYHFIEIKVQLQVYPLFADESLKLLHPLVRTEPLHPLAPSAPILLWRHCQSRTTVPLARLPCPSCLLSVVPVGDALLRYVVI